ncbi:hypothetical protein [Rubrivivax albus]|uniref:Uncharacterized protein n=1 Tax=Rubrivivax albus TaxID=2499835 RepID=A0A3S2TT85_9BURK|nr:hypothetical protein [Rubrivivax albus]RVT54273.1 hypothetical protein ENE75_05320 [Rubrivivax albus]
MRRYRCAAAGCGWHGLLDAPRPAAWALALPRRPLIAAALGTGMLAAAATGWWLHKPVKDERVMVGRHVVHRGTHLEGDQLPTAHPLRLELPAALLDGEPEGFAETPEARLHARRHCAWGLPGRNPYRGSAVQAMQTAQLSPTVVKAIAADIQAGRKVDRVTIRNDGIVAHKSGRVFDARRVAMTYGMTMCVDTRVNFKPGHTEDGDLYEAMDEDGRIYAVMVPDVCGNVSVLGQRFVKSTPEAAAAATGGDPRPWLRLPPELRPRMLPDKLRYTDYREPKGDGEDGGGDGELPEPGSLLLAALALAAAVGTTLRARRRRG